MNKSQQIRIDVNNPDSDKFLKIKLEQNVDVLELLTLKIKTKDIYRSFNSDYGVLVGRVIANNGIGIPNAKVSIFIPLTEEDENDDEISSIYPYKTPRDKNVDGKRYNLLPRVGEIDPQTGGYKPKQPFGSFPTKPEIVTNKTFLNIYKKYYKFSTVTNSLGDYMIFGAPIGLYTVHMSVDLTDIGKYSMTPSTMVVELGYSPNLFTNNNTKVKPNNDLDDLPHIETQEISVDIKPFWGNKEIFQIGITRQDFRIRAELVNTFVVFGSAFTDGNQSAWGTGDNYKIRGFFRLFPAAGGEKAETNLGIISKRTAEIRERILYYPQDITDEKINTIIPDEEVLGLLVLDKSEYSSNKRNGDFVFEISCNRKKIIVNDVGDEVVVGNNYVGGIYKEFRGFFLFDLDDDNLPINLDINFGRSVGLEQKRSRLKIPQYSPPNNAIGLENTLYGTPPNVIRVKNSNWVKQHKVFVGGNLYGVSQFYGTVFNNTEIKIGNVTVPPGSVGHVDRWVDAINNNSRFFTTDKINDPRRDPFWNVGSICVNDENINNDEDSDDIINNTREEFPYNAIQSGSWRHIFGGNWMNFCIQLPQISHLRPTSSKRGGFRCNTWFTTEFINHPQHHDLNFLTYSYDNNWFNPNSVDIGGGERDISRFLRNDLHWSDFVLTNPKDINEFLKYNTKGFIIDGAIIKNNRGDEIGTIILDPNSYYRNGTKRFFGDEYNIFKDKDPCPFNGGKLNGDPGSSIKDEKIYFYKGHGESNCLEFLKELGYI